MKASKRIGSIREKGCVREGGRPSGTHVRYILEVDDYTISCWVSVQSALGALCGTSESWKWSVNG